MKLNRMLILQILILGGMSAVYLLPRHVESVPAGIRLDLPRQLGPWVGEPQKISEKELTVLSKDTEFARMVYHNAVGDEIVVSIVLSGHDMVNSIHRPERCLPAQGWALQDSRLAQVNQENDEMLGSTRLFCNRTVTTREGPLTIRHLNYYWFVGSDEKTPSHEGRTWIDIRDRLVKGYNQRWAYVMVAATVRKDFDRFGKDLEETDAILREFISQLGPQLNPKN